MHDVERYAESWLPTQFGDFRCIVYRCDGTEHVALVKGSPKPGTQVLCRVHSECLTGEVFNSLKCDCKQQLEGAFKMISEAGTGVLIYLRQEGRGIGLGNKVRAYALQEQGLDTVDANRELGFPDDARDYLIAAQILKDLGVGSVLLITNNPSKLEALAKNGIKAKRQGQYFAPNSKEAYRYLRTKQERMGHYPKEND